MWTFVSPAVPLCVLLAVLTSSASAATSEMTPSDSTTQTPATATGTDQGPVSPPSASDPVTMTDESPVTITQHVPTLSDPLAYASATVPQEDGPTTDTTRSEEQKALIPIYLSAYFTFGGGWDGSGILPACQMALEHINQRPDILAGYDLRMIWNDTQCEAGLGTRVFFDQLYREPQKIMILGPACSTATQAVAETAYYWNLVTMSYGAASSALSNRKKFPFFYRTYMPDAMYNPARIRLMREYGWRRVATIHENHELFSLAIDDLVTLLKEANITIISSESFSEDPKNQIENLKSQDAKIIVGNMYEDKARRVFCEAYKLGMTGPDYVWMIIGWYRENWWMDEDPNIRCTVQEMNLAVEGAQYLSTESLQLSTSTEPTIAGITPTEYERLLRDRMTWPENVRYTWNSLAPYGYDAAWAIALALNKSVEVLKSERYGRRLEDFTYDDREMAELFFTLLNETEFDGVSGPVGFKGGDRVGITQIEQLQASCPEGWFLHHSTCFLFVSQPVLPSSEAGDHCAASRTGATLAHLDSELEHDFLIDTWTSEIQAAPDRWLVLMLLMQGDAMNTSWIPTGSSPDVTEDGACVYIDFKNGGKLQRTDCDAPLPFICRVHAEFAERQVALYSALDNELVWRREIIWPGDGPPPDRTPQYVMEIVRQYQGVSPVLYFCVSGVTVVCIIVSLCFLAFNVRYRQQKHVKMSSPNLNNLIILGAVLVYLFVIVSGLDTNIISQEIFEIMCYVKTWTLSVGFVLAFGAMFSKTWRVHRVAAFKTPKRRIVTDKQLFIMVFVLLLVDVIILILWQVIDPVRLQSVDLYQQDDPEIPNRIIQPFIRYCTCDTLTYWLGALYGYKGLLLIFGTFLAWETRKVSIPGLNDSKLIGVSVYNVVILCLIGVAVSVVISSNPEALFVFVSCIILFCTSITLIVVFVPKIIAVVKYPDGDPTQTAAKTRTNLSETSNSVTTTSLTTENLQLKSRIRELENQIKAAQGPHQRGPHPEAGDGCGFWSCGLVCGFSPSRGKDYSADETITETHSQPVAIDEPSGVSTAAV
ncbi:uncharacterized protein LOC119740441 [Patiria miniata]|uniref:Gamma-aminobutyric acid type B receptor subunit 2 n=1 Tax=Patiria miniata TaxID=46514 RepID=A0A914B6D0_PATMI|nr:uncharacterized protein LOC119740441 [Patiria miniata]